MNFIENFANKKNGIEYKVGANTTKSQSKITAQLNQLGSQGHADAVGDKLIGKDPKLVNINGGKRIKKNKKLNSRKKKYLKYGGESSFLNPTVAYKPGSSSERAINSLNRAESKQIQQSNQMNGKAPPIKGGKKKYSKKKNILRGGSNYPVDVNSNISTLQQWSNPKVSAPLPAYNGGRYIGPQFNGPWGNLPITPTTTNMINNNLKSSDSPPGATIQYPGTNHQGNNFIAMPGVNWYNKTPDSNPGGFRLKCTQTAGKKKNKKKSKKR